MKAFWFQTLNLQLDFSSREVAVRKRALAAIRSISTRSTSAAPREAASKPKEPVPANRSKTLALAISNFPKRVSKMALRTRAVVGRVFSLTFVEMAFPFELPD